MGLEWTDQGSTTSLEEAMQCNAMLQLILSGDEDNSSRGP